MNFTPVTPLLRRIKQSRIFFISIAFCLLNLNLASTQSLHVIKVLLSLTRSNSDGKIGFVKEMNRICVALSRARHGMYVTGNMSMIEGSRSTTLRYLYLIRALDWI
jgi:AAA domain